jgi:hypothetical protein
MLFDSRLQLRLWHCTYDLVYYLSTLDEKDSRDAADTIFGRDIRIGIHVEFADVYLACVFGRELLHDGAQGLAWAAPFCPKIYYA